MINVSQKVCVSSPSPAVSNFCLMRSTTDGTACGAERKGVLCQPYGCVSGSRSSCPHCSWQPCSTVARIISQSQLPLALWMQMPSVGTQDPWGCSPEIHHAHSGWVVRTSPRAPGDTALEWGRSQGFRPQGRAHHTAAAHHCPLWTEAKGSDVGMKASVSQKQSSKPSKSL